MLPVSLRNVIFHNGGYLRRSNWPSSPNDGPSCASERLYPTAFVLAKPSFPPQRTNAFSPLYDHPTQTAEIPEKRRCPNVEQRDQRIGSVGPRFDRSARTTFRGCRLGSVASTHCPIHSVVTLQTEVRHAFAHKIPCALVPGAADHSSFRIIECCRSACRSSAAGS